MARTRTENLEHLRRTFRPVEPGQKYVVDSFRPEDAEGIAALFYDAYGENFPVDSVYDPDEIRRKNAAGEQHDVVGRTTSGDIVGLYTLFRNPPGRHIMEAGSWIVLPAWRNSRLAMQLAQRVHGTPPSHLQLNAVFGQVVCDHMITQRMGIKFNSAICGLELEAMPPRPEPSSDGSNGRISLLNEIIFYGDYPHTVYLPERYAAHMQRWYAATTALHREFAPDTPPQGETQCTVQFMEPASLVKLNVETHGQDLGAQIAAMEARYPGQHCYQLVLPLWMPGASAAVETARRAGYFWGGLLPLWADKDAFFLQKLTAEPDYSKIQLYSQIAKDLLEFIIADRESVRRGE